MDEIQNMNEMQGTVAPSVPPMMVQRQMELEEQLRMEREAGTKRFLQMFWPAVLYGVVYSFCLYRNYYGMLHVVFALATIGFCRWMEHRSGVTQKRDTIFLEVVMVLLSISTGLTGNDVIVCLNSTSVYLLLVIRLIHTYYSDTAWDLLKYLEAMVISVGFAIGHLFQPIVDAISYGKSEKHANAKNVYAILLGALIAIPFLAVVISLLRSADVVFANTLDTMFDFELWELVAQTLLAIFGAVAAYCGITAMQLHPVKEEMKEGKHFSALIAITFLSLTTLVYLLFAGIQILYLFAKNMTLPENYTYAEYAREGFFQLLAVCALNVVLVLMVQKFFQEHVAVKGLLIGICACTYIMVASAMLRMSMYIEAYHLTRKRIMVLWALLTIAILLVGVVIQIVKQDFPLFRYGLVVVCLCYLVLSFGRMDYFIADYNLASMHKNNEFTKLDQSASTVEYWKKTDYYSENATTRYLVSLSTDAASVIAREQGTWVDAYGEEVQFVCAEETWRQFNWSHHKARALFESE